MARQTYIYGLIDPRDNIIRYVGKSNNPVKRFKYHCTVRLSLKRLYYWGLETVPYKRLWLMDLKAAGLKPKLIILERCLIRNWPERERWWVEALMKQATLVNGHLSGRASRRSGYSSRSRMAPAWLQEICPNIDWERAQNPDWQNYSFEERFGNKVSG